MPFVVLASEVALNEATKATSAFELAPVIHAFRNSPGLKVASFLPSAPEQFLAMRPCLLLYLLRKLFSTKVVCSSSFNELGTANNETQHKT
jgi:hypothetical protein